ncbi:MAG: DMT family transporter [Desulfurococcales archaeon]|nr:DMT family transporter [Desulfurococcales archaeon]
MDIKDSKSRMASGLGALLITTLLWGTSFPAIKLATQSVDGITYTWVRGVISLAGLTPVVLYFLAKGKVRRDAIVGGLATGVVFALALWLQGWGTSLTTASNSAFITGLNVVIVYGIDALIKKEPYGLRGLISLTLSVIGLYLISGGMSGVRIGDLLVLGSAFFAALQVELIHKYSSSNPSVFVFFEMVPMSFFVVADMVRGFNWVGIAEALPYLIYLGLVCNDVALAFQVYGQRHFRAYEAAVVYLLEPVSAAVFSYLVLGEVLTLKNYLGAALIVLAMAAVTVKVGGSELKKV